MPATSAATVLPPPSGGSRVLRFDDLFAAVRQIVIGRERACSVHLAHPTVSLYHAILERSPDGTLIVQDLESATGVYVNGRRARGPRPVADGDRVGIGPFVFTRAADVLLLTDGSQGMRVEARGVGRDVPVKGGRRTLLDDVSLVVRPGEFVGLLGPSGSGKSTLMDCLNGRRPATRGAVLANGQDFYEQYANLRQAIGYVPQRDIVHPQLTVGRALYHTAKLRLPADTDPSELEARVDEVVRQMDLVSHRDTAVGSLSGGQVKRVSLGAELLARPSLLYVDEATSGLDAGTEARMMKLFRQLSGEGKSIVCITHAIENVGECDLVIILAGGRLAYYGPPAEAPDYFAVPSLSRVYDRLLSREPAEWHAEYRASRYHKEFVEDRSAGATPPEEPPAEGVGVSPTPSPAAKGADDPSHADAPSDAVRRKMSGLAARYRRARRAARPVRVAWHQFRVLTRRYVELIWRDPRSLRLLLLQAPIVAVLLLVGFANKPYEDEMPVARQLEPSERQLLTQLNAWNLVLADDKVLSDDERTALKTLRFTLSRDGHETAFDGGKMHDYLQPLHDPAASAAWRAAVEATQIRLEDVTPRATVSGKDLVAAFKKAGKSRVAEMLLASKKPVVIMSKIVDPRFTYVLLNILSITVFWFGCNSAAKEIVKEEAVYARERAVNLGIVPYLGSKFLVLAALAAVQALALAGVVYGALWALHVWRGQDYPPAAYMLSFGPQVAVLALLSIVGVAVGLLLSACVSSPDRANALLPYVLIPQIILGGAIIPVRGEPISALAALFSPVCWGFRAVHRGSNLLPDYHPLQQSADYTVAAACTALAVQAAVMLIATAWFLRSKDVGKR